MLAVLQFALFFVYAEPAFFWLGALLVASARSPPRSPASTTTRCSCRSRLRARRQVSGLGWGWGTSAASCCPRHRRRAQPARPGSASTCRDGLAYRLIAVVAAVWILVFALPFVFAVPEAHRRADRGEGRRSSRLRRARARHRALFRETRQTVWFLIASAVFRDGLAGVFTFGGVLAAVTFGFSAGEVIIFGIAANVVAGISTIVSGLARRPVRREAGDRRRAVGLIVSAAARVLPPRAAARSMFWIGGLVLCLFVGPAQASSRALLARLIARRTARARSSASTRPRGA